MKTATLFRIGFAVLLFMGGGISATDADIIQDQGAQGLLWPFGSTRGQTFLADASVATITSIEFYYVSANTGLAPAQPTIIIYEGEGFGGTVVDSAPSPIIPSDSPNGWIDTPFGNASVTPGQMYTFRISQLTGAAGGFAMWGDTSIDVYPNGEHLTDSGGTLTHAYFDNKFRIHGVPEPSSILLALLGVIGLVGNGWRRRRSAQ